MNTDIIHRFLESVGQKADVDLYLRLFRAQEKQSFAIIVADAQIIHTALDPLHFDLRILAGLGLCPVVLIGLFDPDDADTQAKQVYDWLVEDHVPAHIVSVPPSLDAAAIEGIAQVIRDNAIPLVSLASARRETTDARFRNLAQLASALGTRKIVFLSASRGLEREATPHISVVNLTLDYDRLVEARDLLEPRHRTLLRQTKDLLDDVPHKMTVAVVNPLSLLRELFTVNGVGTLIRKGSIVESHYDLGSVDVARLRMLIESAFGRRLRTALLEREIDRLFVEENYRGAALLAPAPVAPYLSKFAVDRTAQGEGIGGDLWRAIVRDYPTFFWRSRPDNSITAWYVRQCDGMARFPEWHVFWRGLPASGIPPAIAYALAQQPDFEPPGAPAS